LGGHLEPLVGRDVAAPRGDEEVAEDDLVGARVGEGEIVGVHGSAGEIEEVGLEVEAAREAPADVEAADAPEGAVVGLVPSQHAVDVGGGGDDAVAERGLPELSPLVVVGRPLRAHLAEDDGRVADLRHRVVLGSGEDVVEAGSAAGTGHCRI
jgi:hypothetical protein